MNLEIKHFKNELSDYNYLKYKLSRVEDMQLELEIKRGIHAIRYDKECTQGSPDPLITELKRLDDIEKMDFLERKWCEYYSRLKRIEDFINGSEVGQSIKKIHCTNESTYEKEARLLFMGVKTLKRRVNKEIARYLSNENKSS